MNLKSGLFTVLTGLLLAVFFVNLASARSQKPKAATATPPKAANKRPAVRTEEVKINGAKLQLAGTLLLPEAEAGKRAPAVIIFGDASPADRDGIPVGSSEHYLYRDLAVLLAGKGLAVLRFDPRCTGASECRPHSSFDDFILDGEAVVKYMRQRPDIDPQRLAIFGHGEGGLQAIVAASHDEGGKDQLAGVVLAATAGRFGHRVIRDQVRVILADQGRSKEEIAAYVARMDQLFVRLNQGESDFKDVALDPKNEADAKLIRLTQNPPFAFGLLTNDPLQTVKTIKAPVLILQGDKDVLMPVSDAEYLDEALQRESHPDFTMNIIKDADYVFKVNKGEKSLKSYRDTTRPLDQQFVSLLTEWLQKRLRTTGE